MILREIPKNYLRYHIRAIKDQKKEKTMPEIRFDSAKRGFSNDFPVMGLCREFVVDRLRVAVYQTPDYMGRAATSLIAHQMRKVAKTRPEINMNLAAAPSQRPVWQHLSVMPDLPWNMVNGTHMDEFLVDEKHPLSFAGMLQSEFFCHPFPSAARFFKIMGTAEPHQEIERYSHVLSAFPTDIQVNGIGENGHMGFNEPWALGMDPSLRPFKANFWDPYLMKLVKLDERCLAQQRKAYPGQTIPDFAISITIRQIMASRTIFCIVPYEQKAQAAHDTLMGLISEACPASALRTHEDAYMFLDMESAGLFLRALPVK